MTVTREQLEKLITLCWQAASHAPMDGIPDGMEVKQSIILQPPGGILNHARFKTYELLLANLVPKTVESQIEMKPEKENWES